MTNGELIGFAKITRDITDQREAQLALEQSREQLAQAQKMEALGQLTGGIAHDFNNLLMIMGGHAQLLQRRLTEAKDLQAIDAIRAAAGRGEKLTRQLLAFSRRQTLTPVVVDLRARIDAVREMLSASLARQYRTGARRRRTIFGRWRPTLASSNWHWSTSRSTRATRCRKAARSRVGP